MNRKAIELIRVSTEAQAADDRASIPAQKAINRRTSSTYNLDIVRSIEITDVSGAMILMSPEMQELLRLIANPDIHGVVSYAFNRIMRPENYSDFAILQVFVDTRTILYLPEGPIDLSSKSGRILGTIQAVIAGNQRLEFLENVWNSKEEKRLAGEFPQSEVCLPFGVGYDRLRGKGGWHYTPEVERVREAFRLFLSGDTSYFSVGRKVGIDPYNLRIILRNPIYTGWRVIDKRRDPSPSAHRVKPDGRQVDRPKIKRAAEEVIRIKVMDEPLISQEEFQRVQQILDLKRARHWRTRPDYEHRFTYNGFLTCSKCGSLIYTKYRRDDYYVCKGRHIVKICDVSYMRRDRLEPKLDNLFANRLTDSSFLRELAEEMESSASRQSNAVRIARLQSEIESLESKRGRILDAYFEGVISSQERDLRLAKIDRDLHATQELLLREKPSVTLSVDSLVSLFSPFFEWQYLKRDDKRRILSTIVPDIRVADYQVSGLYLLPPCGDNVTHTGKGSSQRRA
jgi:DNA invertase Pin-like site-specific DNA recombinase